MKLLISWSGSKSHEAAKVLKDWFPVVINAIEPWLSSTDIEAGARWGSELATQLENTRFGIICLTEENILSPWIHFEAGALSKAVDSSRVVPYLLGIRPAEVSGPLAQFQAVGSNEEGTRKLLSTINQTLMSEGEKGVDDKVLDKSFSHWWPKLNESLGKLPAPEKEEHSRSDREILEEILLLTRSANAARRGEAIGEVLGSSMINTLLDVYYRRALEISESKGIAPPEKPPVITTGVAEQMGAEYINNLLQKYFKLSIDARSSSRESSSEF